jgi:hypothetical protein
MGVIALPVEVVGKEEPVREVEVGDAGLPGVGCRMSGVGLPESDVEVVPNQSQPERTKRGTSRIPLHK